jgi:hypothetical protein
VLVNAFEKYVCNGLSYSQLNVRSVSLRYRGWPQSPNLETQIICRSTFKSNEGIAGRMAELTSKFVLYCLG